MGGRLLQAFNDSRRDSVGQYRIVFNTRPAFASGWAARFLTPFSHLGSIRSKPIFLLAEIIVASSI